MKKVNSLAPAQNSDSQGTAQATLGVWELPLGGAQDKTWIVDGSLEKIVPLMESKYRF